MRKPKRPRSLRGRALSAAPIAAAGQNEAIPISRRVSTRSKKRVAGYFPTRKSGHMVPWESELERDYFYLLESDPDVAGFAVQPEEMELIIDQRLRIHFPDILVVAKTGERWIADVKADPDVKELEESGIAAATAKICLQRGYGYKIIRASFIREQPRLGNSKLIARHRGDQVPDELLFRAQSALANAPRSASQMTEALGLAVPYAFGVLLHLAAIGAVDVNREVALSIESQFFKRN
jgi:hypothetical protein